MQRGKHTSATKSLETAKEVRTLVKWWYRHAQEVKDQGGHIAWAMVNIPTEILPAFDVVPLFPEQYASACAAKQMAIPFVEKAEAEGYAVEICSYERIGLGYSARCKEAGGYLLEAPYGGLPRPDFLVGRSLCEPGYKWFQAIQRYQDVPCFIFDGVTPSLLDADFADEDVSEQYVKYYSEQLKELVAFLERHTGRRLNQEKLRLSVERSQKTRSLSYDIFEMRKAVPCPMSTEDRMACVFPVINMEGTEQALHFVEALHGEVKSRVNSGVGVVPQEDYRLMWVGVPPWHTMSLFDYFKDRYRAVFVVETTFVPPVPVDLDVSNLLEAIAKRLYWGGFAVNTVLGRPKRSEENYGAGPLVPANLVLRLAKEYLVDGVVMHYIPSCRWGSLGSKHVQQLLRSKVDLPCLVIEGDMTDRRAYDETETEKRIDVFMELLRNRRRQSARLDMP